MTELRPPTGVVLAETADDAGRLAATAVETAIESAIRDRGTARVVFASAPSQQSMLLHLGGSTRIDWSRVRSFHMDEYLGLSFDHPQAFGQWLADRLPAGAIAGFERIRSEGDSQKEIDRYTAALSEAPIDVTCLGIGVNGHIAFNEPGARFDDDQLVRRVRLDELSRQQQFDDGLFATIDAVPTQALSLTIPALMSAKTMVATVLGARKAVAVRAALHGPISESCPATALRRHADASVYLDAAAGELLGGKLSATP